VNLVDRTLWVTAVKIHQARCTTFTDDLGPCEQITETDLGIATTVLDTVLTELRNALNTAHRRAQQRLINEQGS